MTRLLRIGVRLLIVGGVAVVVLTLLAVVVVQTPWFKDRLRQYVMSQAQQYLNADLSVGRLGGSLFSGVELADVSLGKGQRTIISVSRITFDYNLVQLLTRGVVLDRAVFVHPVVVAEQDADGWNLSRVVKRTAQEGQSTGPARPLGVKQLEIVDGDLRIHPCGPPACPGAPGEAAAIRVPKRLDDVDAVLSVNYQPVKIAMDVDSFSVTAHAPDLAVRKFSGHVTVTSDDVALNDVALVTGESSMRLNGHVSSYRTAPRLAITASGERLSTQEIARLVPAVARLHLSPRFSLDVKGRADDLRVKLALEDPAGRADGQLQVRAERGGERVLGDVHTASLDLSKVLQDPALSSDLTGHVWVNIRATDWRRLDTIEGALSLNADGSRAAGYRADALTADATMRGGVLRLDATTRAYGAYVTAHGTITPRLDDPARTGVDLRGHASGVNLARLPRQLAVPRLDTQITGDYHVLRRDSRLDAQLQLDDSSVEDGRIGRGATVRASVGGGPPAYSFAGDVANVNVRRVGQALRITALTTERFESALTGHVALDGAGTALGSGLRLHSDVTLRDSRIAGASVPALRSTVDLDGQRLHLVGAGVFAGLDPAAVGAGPNLSGDLRGRIEANLTINGVGLPIATEGFSGTAHATLDGSRLAGLSIDRAAFAGRFDHDRLDIGNFEVVGPALNARANGSLILGANGESALNYRAESERLEDLAKLVGRPLSGRTLITGRLGGNRSEYVLTGDANANSFRYGATADILQAKTKYSVRVPELRFADARADLDLEASLPTIAGRQLRSVAAKVTYRGQELQFDGTVTEAKRSLAAAGSVLLHPDHQELHVQRMVLATQGVQWQLTPGSTATIQYGAETVRLENVRLVSGQQTLDARGTLGLGGQATTDLAVDATELDLNALSQVLLLQIPGLRGTLNANARVRGAGTARSGHAQFTIGPGAIRGFTFETASGDLQFSPATARVDVRVQQSANAILAATGTIPSTLLGASGPANGQFDIHVTSNAVNLAILEAATDAVSKVSGTLRTDLHLTGTTTRPRVVGELQLQNAAFALSPVGDRMYSGLNTTIRFQGDRVTLENFRVLDHNHNALDVQGELSVDGLRPNAFTATLTSRNFEVMNNEFGDVQLDSDLAIKGQLTAPSITGSVTVTAGRLEIDHILETLTARANRTPVADEAADANRRPAAQSEPAAGLTLDLNVTVPNDLVIRGSDIRTASSPVAIGSVNATFGGDFRIQKAPAGDPLMIGTIRTVRGTYDFQGRRFTILRDGRIMLHGGAQESALDLTAQREISGIIAQVRVGGTVRRPSVELSSQPPMDDADVLALIVFNQPLNQLDEGQRVSLAERAGAMASGFVVSPLAASIGKALDLDVFELKAIGPEGAGPSLNIGQQFGERLYVNLEQNFGAQNMTEFALEYELSKFLRLRGAMAEGETRANRLLTRRAERAGVDLVLLIRY